jgi:hypothetical protein
MKGKGSCGHITAAREKEDALSAQNKGQENGEALSAHNQAAELSRKNNQSYFQCAFRRLTVTHSFFFLKE